MPLKKTGSRQKVCEQVSMVGLAPGRESSVLTEPVSRPPRGNPKLEERSVGGSVALSPCIPDAQHTKFPGEFPKPPAVRGTGLVDGAVSLEEPEAHKPGQRRQVSNTVSKVSIRGRNGTVNEDKVSIQVHEAEMAQQEDDPHGLLAHGPQRTSKKNDPHGLLRKSQI